jgi:glutamate-ammonia-ligase adenylyltransferase
MLDDFALAQPWLKGMNLADAKTAHDNLCRIAAAGVTLDLMAHICRQFAATVPSLADPDMALNNLERFIAESRSPMSSAALFERDSEALPNLLQLFSTSQYLSNLLIVDNEAYDLLRITDGQPVARDSLIEELDQEVATLTNKQEVMASLRRFKRREILRIAFGDIIRSQTVATVARQISYLADAIIEVAVRFARRSLEELRGEPQGLKGNRARFVVLALGKLGGVELNYSSDIDLVFFYDLDGQTDAARPISNHEFFERLGCELVKLLSESTNLGIAYRFDLRLRPEGSQGEVCMNFDRALSYYDNKARTWERQAFVKARAVAGDLNLGHTLLKRLETWVYRRFLSRADITGIRGIKQRIERRAETSGQQERDVKTGYGGIRDIEFAIQFLQLLNGGSLPEIRGGNTLEAIANLEKSGCLTNQESLILADNYSMLRKLEHRLQIMFDLQTHMMQEDPDELRKLAIRLGYSDAPEAQALETFQADYLQWTSRNHQILNHLLHDAFEDDQSSEPEVDLVNDPQPSKETIAKVLGKYPFSDIPAAYNNLMALATEKIRFLSTRRCRHFLAAIAPRLLEAIADTPQPDATLVNLSRVSDSLGGKSALWELFSTHRPTLNLYVSLCAACPYLASILTSHPGMIDELMDSLVVDKLPTHVMLEETLADLSRGAEDLEPILHSFKNAQHMRVGVRDMLGKDDIRATHATLSDVAETCLKQIATIEYSNLVEKFGEPTITRPSTSSLEDPISQGYWNVFADREGDICEAIILAIGKLGGREPNYHSDLDLVFLYEADGNTVHRTRPNSSKPTTSNAHFFGELGQRIMKVAHHLGPYGRLYEVDPRLRPTGRSGLLAVPLDGFARYFAEGRGQLWERQALCKSRVIVGSPQAAGLAVQAVSRAVFAPGWQPPMADEIRAMRKRLEKTASPHNLKRGKGGTVDTEFVVQMHQLKHGHADPAVRVPGTLDALLALEHGGYLSKDDSEYFQRSYRFQRSVEARIRLMNLTGRHEFPTEENELAKLAYLLGYANPARLVEEADAFTQENRRRFNRLFDAAAAT